MYEHNTALYIVIPIRNRKKETESIITQLLQQDLDSSLKYKIIFVDSKSTDGSYEMVLEYCKIFENISIIKGKNSWFWARAVSEGIEQALISADSCDYVLLLNDDVFIPSNYLKTHFKYINLNFGSIISSRVRLVDYPFEMFENFPYFSYDRIGVSVCRDVAKLSSTDHNLKVLATGKGTSYPVEFLYKHKLKFRQIPHHLADLNLSLNTYEEEGTSIIAPHDLTVFTELCFGTDFKAKNILTNYFHKKSPSRILSFFFFYKHMYGLRRLFINVTKFIKSKIHNNA